MPPRMARRKIAEKRPRKTKTQGTNLEAWPKRRVLRGQSSGHAQ